MAQLPADPGLRPVTGPASRLRVGFIGSGRAAASLARSLARDGDGVVLATRGASAADLGRELGVSPRAPRDVLASSDLVVLAVPDGRVAEVARTLALDAPDGAGRVVAHLAGSLGLEPLRPLGHHGYALAAVHPLQVLSGWRIPPGTTFAVEAEPAARPVVRRLVADLSGVELELPAGSRATYHAAAVLAANLGMSLLGEAVDLLERSGIERDKALEGLAGLVRGGLEASVDRGLPAALTGPVTRGDITTVRAHLEAIAGDPELDAAYSAVSLLALRQAGRNGRPDAAAAARLRALLEEKT